MSVEHPYEAALEPKAMTRIAFRITWLLRRDLTQH